jgi:hypothetical protein
VIGIPSTPTTELTKQVMTFDRPHVDFTEIALPIYNSTVKIAGKYKWSDVNCELRDDSVGNVSRLLGEQLQKQLNFQEMSSAAAASDYKFTTTLQILDGGNGINEPIVLEQWNILGCYLKDVNYNKLDYNESQAVKITMAITFDNAVQSNAKGENVGVGQDMNGRTTRSSLASAFASF